MKPQHVLTATTAVSSLSTSLGSATPIPNIVSIPAEYTYLLPAGFQGNLTQDFILTDVDDPTITALLSQAQVAPFISYSAEFTNLLGSATLDTIVAPSDTDFPYSWAGEAGIWLPDLNQVWCTATYDRPASLYIISLDTNTVTKFEGPLAGPAGGYYFNGTVYLALTGDATGPAGVVAIDPRTHKVTPVVNSYFGLELPPVDDLVVTYTGGQKHMYFTSLSLDIFDLYIGRGAAVLPNAVWRFSPETRSLVPIIPRADVFSPNGIAANREFTHLYVTDSSATATVGGGAAYNMTSSPAIYRYDLSAEGTVSNKVLLGFAREGVPDGLKIDDHGRIWTAEYEGIVVRSPAGRVLGVFNKQVMLGTAEPTIEITNFALAGDTLVVLAVDRVHTVTLTETVMEKGRFSVPGL
ncbi:SMP-30/gluconolactonase/LRE family protein [Aspergillus puulaauensis]|uniref:SMP-30/Gluconolactonase/LRE-like region domain-containing protein n=1 Tax=Aspergillus puulaauensis TaxID=1220207 RepID=A0A7R8ARF5_9EURO|nr:uncharacterized protein APUU_61095S [Aspergillus puulaauensis]BCS28047.1 hypothetical protein APUU_61095S [Aspergillus puulaauensis]